MIRFYFHPTPNPAKVALLLEELGLPYEVVPVDTAKGEQHAPAFRAINPNGKVPAIVDTEGPGGREARVFDSSAILLYLGEKAGRFVGAPADRPELLSWLFFISSRHLARSPVRRCISSTPRRKSSPMPSIGTGARSSGTIVSSTNIWPGGTSSSAGDYSIADMSAWGWLTRAARVLPGEGETLAGLPESQATVRKGRRPPGRGAGESGRQGSSVQERDGRADKAGDVPVELRGYRDVMGGFKGAWRPVPLGERGCGSLRRAVLIEAEKGRSVDICLRKSRSVVSFSS